MNSFPLSVADADLDPNGRYSENTRFGYARKSLAPLSARLIDRWVIVGDKKTLVHSAIILKHEGDLMAGHQDRQVLSELLARRLGNTDIGRFSGIHPIR